MLSHELRTPLNAIMGFSTMIATAADDAVVYRHRWNVRDLVFWDNRCLMHHATPYPAHSIRHMNRTTVAGSVPV